MFGSEGINIHSRTSVGRPAQRTAQHEWAKELATHWEEREAADGVWDREGRSVNGEAGDREHCTAHQNVELGVLQ